MQHALPSPVSRSGRRIALAAVGALVAIAVALPASASAAAFRVRVKFPNHTPVMKRNWPITVYAWRGRTKLSGNVSYRFYYQGTFEKAEPGVNFKHGVAHDKLLFPPAAVGHRLTLQVVVKTRYGTERVNWTVTAKK